MPSLRRSFSSPSVRSSPYPTSLSTASVASSRARTGGQHPRRSSGSSASERRVLADIEWWRVFAGQCPSHVHDQDQDQDQDDVQTQGNTILSLGGSVMLSAGGGYEPPQAPLSLHDFSLDLTQSMSPNELATLSVVPHSPPGRWHGPDSSSSLESSPGLITVPLETIHLGLDLENSTAQLCNSELPLFPSSLRVASRPAPMLHGFRSFSFGGFPSRESTGLQFADMGGDTFSLDQNLFR